MKLRVFDPGPVFANEYVSKMFLDPIRDYAYRNGIEVSEVAELIPAEGCATICNADHLTPNIIRWFHDNGCPLFAISCIDSAWLSEPIRHCPEAWLISKIFMVSGIPNTNESTGLMVDSDLSLIPVPKRFLPDDEWTVFNQMKMEGRILSLPYVPWERMATVDPVPFEQRRPTVLFRGGSHFFRVLAYYFALQKGIADPNSGFSVRDYFREDMVPQFRYCDNCRAPFHASGQWAPRSFEHCNSPAHNGNAFDLSSPPSWWNNRCPESFYWLAQRFQKRYSAMKLDQVVNAFNFTSQVPSKHLQAISQARFYGDAKWEFTINCSQRFWEAASVGTINLLPHHTNDQDYFPAMREGEHYLTFSNDLADISADVSKEDFERIATNAKALYEEWIRPTDYAISTNLLKHIFKEMSQCLS